MADVSAHAKLMRCCVMSSDDGSSSAKAAYVRFNGTVIAAIDHTFWKMIGLQITGTSP